MRHLEGESCVEWAGRKEGTGKHGLWLDHSISLVCVFCCCVHSLEGLCWCVTSILLFPLFMLDFPIIIPLNWKKKRQAGRTYYYPS